MDLKKRNTKKYSFKEPDLSQLRELGALVPFPEDFQKRYGKLLSILNTNVEEGILNTLVQFNDPIYHCFTFVDYQLVPTLEEYSYWVGLPISERVPYTGLEEFPAPSVIANALHLKTSDVVSSRTKKGGFQGLTSNFLFGRAFVFAKNGDVAAFEAILALLIYGLVLFPNIDSFVDNSAIQIFLGGNPVPTLLADAYHSIHHRTHKGEGLILCFKVARRPRPHPSRTYNTRANRKKRMDQVEQENVELHGEVTTLRAEVEKLTAMVTSLVAAQNQPLTPPPQAIVISEIASAPVPVVPINTHQHVMPEGYPWGMPMIFNEGLRPQVPEVPTPTLPHATVVPQPGTTLRQVTMCVPQSTMTIPASVAHTVPYVSEQVYHAEDPETYGRMDNLQDQFDKMQLEIKALRGKDLFGKNAHDLCLVPNVRIPPKFKVPEFEKYKGNSCPQSHLVMYARKMSTQTDNYQLLVHYFQDSLTGAALKWYMGLDGAKIQTFNDLGEAFVRQYKYNLDMAPDRDQLRGMSQKDKESFKEYAQRWREIAAQICPPLEEKEITKIFLNTLDSFYYERMIASAPSDFTEMVNMGMRLEEGVRQGRLVRESVPVNSTKRFGSNFARRKESEVSMVAHGQHQRPYMGYQHVAAVSPVPQNPPYQPQMTQRPPSQYPPLYQQTYPQQPYPQQPQIRPQTPQQPYNYPNRTQRNPSFDPIPMKYADLLPALLAKNFVQTRPPPPAPAVLPTWYRSDLTCAFHQGAPGHDVERCYAFKKAVQELIRNKVLSFKDENPNVRNNPLPNHGSSVHFIQSCQETSTILSIKDIKTSLVPIHSKMCEAKLFCHDHATCEECLKNPQGCSRVQEDIQRLMDKGELVVTKKSEDVCVIVPEFNVSDRLEMIYNSGEPTVTPLVICLPGPMPYTSLRAVPYRYDATMLQDGVETPIPPLISVDNIADNSKILRSGRILPGVVQGKTGSPVEKTQIPDSSGTGEKVYEDSDEVLKMIKRKMH
ncbi:hypothetical protein TSUD_416070 [Trifolium subterraneum]|uniref:Uncharacterized protein n=1 Tax=Trifolium subterraneum TaxID=3900 RepID=A0A2Z6PLF5_TRISU|nr:hypothetical protein TSUD_416070 [Trifolium subterraneum]